MWSDRGDDRWISLRQQRWGEVEGGNFAETAERAAEVDGVGGVEVGEVEGAFCGVGKGFEEMAARMPGRTPEDRGGVRSWPRARGRGC